MAEAKTLNIVVTGASRGLGLAITEHLADAGYRVVAVSRALSEDLAAAQGRHDGLIHHVAADLLETDSLRDVIRAAKVHGPIFGLVNNAGLGTDGLLSNMHASQVDALIKLNVTAPIMLSKYAVRDMMVAGGGRIINMASVIASTGYSGLSVYGATKASMVGFTKSLAREVGRFGVTVNAIAPGFVDTAMTQVLGDAGREQVVRRAALRRLAEPADIAAMAVFLMGEGGRNITGQVMTVDAGATA